MRTFSVKPSVHLEVITPYGRSRRVPADFVSRSFTVASGSFPANLSEYKKNCQYERLRYDWLYWFAEVKDGPSLPRSPSFGDYAIQHPFYLGPDCHAVCELP